MRGPARQFWLGAHVIILTPSATRIKRGDLPAGPFLSRNDRMPPICRQTPDYPRFQTSIPVLRLRSGRRFFKIAQDLPKSRGRSETLSAAVEAAARIETTGTILADCMEAPRRFSFPFKPSAGLWLRTTRGGAAVPRISHIRTLKGISPSSFCRRPSGLSSRHRQFRLSGLACTRHTSGTLPPAAEVRDAISSRARSSGIRRTLWT